MQHKLRVNCHDKQQGFYKINKNNLSVCLSFFLSLLLKKLYKTIEPMNYIKVALGVCFALKWWIYYLLLFTYLIIFVKDVTSTTFTTNGSLKLFICKSNTDIRKLDNSLFTP